MKLKSERNCGSVVALAGAGVVVEGVTPSTNAKNCTPEATCPAHFYYL